MNILVVDDNDVNRKLAGACARRLGYSVQEVCDGQSALEALQTHHYDVVLLDICMPGMSGEEVLTQWTSSGKGNRRETKVVAYTAHAMPDEKQHFLEVGFDGLLIKPASLTAIETALKEASE